MNFDDFVFGEFGTVVIAAKNMLTGTIKDASFTKIEFFTGVWI